MTMKDRRLKGRRTRRTSLKRRATRKRVGGVEDLSPFLQDDSLQETKDIEDNDFYTQIMQECNTCHLCRPKDLFDCKDCKGRGRRECYYTKDAVSKVEVSNDKKIPCDLKYIANGIGPTGQFPIKNNIVAVRYSEAGKFPWIMMSDALNLADFHVLIIPGITPSTDSRMSEAMKSIGGLFMLSNAGALLREMEAFRDAVCKYIVNDELLPKDIYVSLQLQQNVTQFREIHQFTDDVKQNIPDYIVSGFNYPGSQELLHMQIVLSPTMWQNEYENWMRKVHFETPRFIPTETFTPDVVRILVDKTKQQQQQCVGPIPFGKIDLSCTPTVEAMLFAKRHNKSTFWQAIGETSIMRNAQEKIDFKRNQLNSMEATFGKKENRDYKTIQLSNIQFFDNNLFVQTFNDECKKKCEKKNTESAVSAVYLYKKKMGLVVGGRKPRKHTTTTPHRHRPRVRRSQKSFHATTRHTKTTA